LAYSDVAITKETPPITHGSSTKTVPLLKDDLHCNSAVTTVTTAAAITAAMTASITAVNSPTMIAAMTAAMTASKLLQ